MEISFWNGHVVSEVAHLKEQGEVCGTLPVQFELHKSFPCEIALKQTSVAFGLVCRCGMSTTFAHPRVNSRFTLYPPDSVTFEMALGNVDPPNTRGKDSRPVSRPPPFPGSP